MTRLLIVCAVVVAVADAAVAQAPATPRVDPASIRMRGDRFKPLTYNEMTPAQKTMLEHLLAGPRGSTGSGPFNVLLRSPEIGDLGQEFGASTRFRSSLPQRLYELAILVTARHWTAQYEWQAHSRSGLQAGLSPAVVDAIARGERPTGMKKDEEVVYAFCHELLNTKQVSDATFAAIKAELGERGIVDVIAVTGWYNIVSMLLNVDRYPVAEGTEPPLKPLR